MHYDHNLWERIIMKGIMILISLYLDSSFHRLLQKKQMHTSIENGLSKINLKIVKSNSCCKNKQPKLPIFAFSVRYQLQSQCYILSTLVYFPWTVIIKSSTFFPANQMRGKNTKQ